MASNQKSLEEMLRAEVDESEITALVSQLDRPMTQDSGQSRLAAKAALMDGLSVSANAHNTNTTSASVHNSSNSSITTQDKLKLLVNSSGVTLSGGASDVPAVLPHQTSGNTITNVNNGQVSHTTNTTINTINTINNNNSPSQKLLSTTTNTTTGASLGGALPASGYLAQVTTSSNAMSSVSTGVATNQILKNAIAVSSLANGSPSGSPSPSPLQQSLQSANNAAIRPSLPTTTISLSAIPSSLVITPNKTTGVGPKPGQTLLIATSKDGSMPPMIVQPSANPLPHVNNTSSAANDTASATTGVGSVPTTSSIVTIASRNLVTSGGAGAAAAHPPNLMQQLVSNHQNIQFVMANTSRPQTPTANIANRTLAPRVVQLPHNVRLTPQMIRGPAPGQGFTGQGTITLPSNLVRAGTIFVKTENGQVHMVNVAPPPTTANTPANLQQTLRLQVPTTSASPAATAVRNLGNQHIVLPVSMAGALHNRPGAPPPAQSVNQPLHISTAAANQQSSATTPSQMSPNTAKKKCKNFLSTLIRLASDQPPNVANNVKNLIQNLIDDAIQPEDFTNQLQKELNSSPQPCLVPFLRKSLPYLRYSLMQKELTIDGVRPPPSGAVSLPQQSQNIPQIQISQTPRPGLTQTVRLLTPVSGLMAGQATTVLTPLSHTTPQRLTTPQNVIRPPATATTASSRPSKASAAKARVSATKDKEKKNNFSSSLRDDDDINDVAAMGGVNLQEESQRILATNADIVGQQIRSCKDENFLFTTPLHKKINEIAKKHGLDDCSQEVVSLVSHAVQEKLKTLVEKLGVIAEHRQEQIKNYPYYEVEQDVKGQVMFLQELDRIEKRKHEEQEREVLIKAAKSRSKADDPDHLAIKMRAKEMQRQEMEELRQREANETALQAIGNPKKRLKTSLTSMTPTNSQSLFSSATNSGQSSAFSHSSLKPMRRIKRVSLKDLHFLMETERETVRTPILYKAYLK